MENAILKIILSDGTEIGNLTLNGNNFISKEKIEPTIFAGNCSPVILSDGEKEEIHNDMELVQVEERNGEYWFILRDLSSEELSKIKMQSDIEYVAMMTGVEL